MGPYDRRDTRHAHAPTGPLEMRHRPVEDHAIRCRDDSAEDHDVGIEREEQVLETRRRIIGAENPATLSTAINLAIVTGKNGVGEGSMGFNSNLQERPNLTPCP